MNKAVFLFLSVMDFGGQERFVSRLSEILSKRYDVFVVLFDSSNIGYPVYGRILDIKLGEFKRRNILSKIIKTFVRYYRMRSFIRLYKPVACISFGRGPNLINLLCKRRNIKVFPSVRGYATAEHITKSYLDRRLYCRADKIVCVSKGIDKIIRESVLPLRNKTTVLYNAYDVERIVQLSSEELGCQNFDGTPKLISVGTFRPEKGYWHLIKAVFVLKPKFPRIHLLILGNDYQNNGANLRSLVDKLGLCDNVTFDSWKTNPYSYIKKSDIYVLSSIREGFPNALVEGMVCGKPVVAADCLTGPREILSKKAFDTEATSIELADYGILVPRLGLDEDYGTEISPEEEKLAEAIELLASNSELMKSYSDLSKQRAAQFSYDHCEKDYIRLIEGESS